MDLHFFFFFFMVLRKSPIRWSKKQLKLYVCSIKTRVAIHFPKRFFFFFFQPKIGLVLKGLKFYMDLQSHIHILYVP